MTEDQVRSALVATRDYLSTLDPNQFDMGVSYAERECNTVACIGGWMAYLQADPDPAEFVQDNYAHPVLGELFFPSSGSENVSLQQAIQAIDNVLDHGTPDWDKMTS